MGAASAPNCGDDEWEICNDDGFVHKRRRHLRPVEAEDGQPPPAAEDPEADLRRHRRAQRHLCLLGLRDRYRRELEQWERLSSALIDPAAPPPSAATTSSFSASEPPPPGEVIQRPLVDDLLSQVKAQEAVLRKLSEMCDHAESLCREKEESLVESLMELPIWGSPGSLMTSLSN